MVHGDEWISGGENGRKVHAGRSDRVSDTMLRCSDGKF